jgi:hypothetical protein
MWLQSSAWGDFDMSDIRDVIDADGTRRAFDIDTAELSGMGADQTIAVARFREPGGEAISVVLGRTSYRVLSGWIAQNRSKAERQLLPGRQAVAA